MAARSKFPKSPECPSLVPSSAENLIAHLRALGFEQGRGRKPRIPNPYTEDIGRSELIRYRSSQLFNRFAPFQEKVDGTLDVGVLVLNEADLGDVAEIEPRGELVAEVVAGVIQRGHRFLLLAFGAAAGDADRRVAAVGGDASTITPRREADWSSLVRPPGSGELRGPRATLKQN
jgi:hypothetical protein